MLDEALVPIRFVTTQSMIEVRGNEEATHMLNRRLSPMQFSQRNQKRNTVGTPTATNHDTDVTPLGDRPVLREGCVHVFPMGGTSLLIHWRFQNNFVFRIDPAGARCIAGTCQLLM